jgi:hypothetical protein
VITALGSSALSLRRAPLQHIHARERHPGLLSREHDDELALDERDPFAVAIR